MKAIDEATVYRQINNHLTSYCVDIFHLNHQGLTDGAVFAENRVAELGKVLYGACFTNTNVDKSNFAAIDLRNRSGDEVIQVTTQSSGWATKKKSTIAKFLKDNGNNQVKVLIIIFLTHLQVPSDDLKEVEIERGRICKCYDLKAILTQIKHLGLDKKLEILKILDSKLGKYLAIDDLDKPVFSTVEHYVQRRVLIEPASGSSDISKTGVVENTIGYIAELLKADSPLRLLIKGEAAMGKSQEMINIAAFTYGLGTGIYPVIVYLNNYSGNLEKYVSYYLKDFDDYSPGNILLLFDGLDDVPGASMGLFINEFNLFVQARPLMNIIACVRTNVYSKEFGLGVTSELRLTNCILQELNEEDINSYILDRTTPNEQAKFRDYIKKSGWAREILSSPFYLSNITDLIRQSHVQMPDSRSALIETFLELKFNVDHEKYLSQIDIPALKEFANRLAVYLTLGGKNAISTDSFSAFTGLSIQAVRKSSLFKTFQKDFREYISFEHNNFQEYLCAVNLIKLNWQSLKDLLFQGDIHPILRPKLINTVNFIFTILPSNHPHFTGLLGLLIADSPEILFGFERDKLSRSLRLEIFKSYINKGKSEKIDWLRGTFQPNDLTSYVGHSKSAFKYILTEITENVDTGEFYNLLTLVRSFPRENISVQQRSDLYKLLRNLLSLDGHPPVFFENILFTLNFFEFFNAEILAIIKSLPCNTDRDMRRSILKFIKDGNFDDEFDYVLTSDVVIQNNGTSGFNLQHIYFGYLAMHLNRKRIIQTLDYFRDNHSRITKILETGSFSSPRPLNDIYSSAAEFFMDGESKVLDSMTALVQAIKLTQRNLKAWGEPENFFKRTGTTRNLFLTLLTDEHYLSRSVFLSKLFDPSLIPEIISLHASGNMSFSSIRKLLNQLEMGGNPALDELKSTLEKTFPLSFDYSHNAFRSVDLSRMQMDISILSAKNNSLLLKEAKKIYKILTEKMKQGSGQDILAIRYPQTIEEYSAITNNIVWDLVEDYDKFERYGEFKRFFDSVRWESFVFEKCYALIRDGKVITDELMDRTIQYLKTAIIPNLDIRKEMAGTASRYQSNDSPFIQVVYFFNLGKIDLEQEVLLDLLYLPNDYVSVATNGANQEFLYKLIYKKVGGDIFKNQVLSNINEQGLPYDILIQQIFLIKEFRIEEALEGLYGVLETSEYDSFVKQEVVSCLEEFDIDLDRFADLLDSFDKIDSNWKFKVCVALSKSQQYQQEIRSKIEETFYGLNVISYDSYWKNEMLLTAVRLGSFALATRLIESLSDKAYLPTFMTLEPLDFYHLCQVHPQELIEICIDILPGTIKEKGSQRYDLVSEVLEGIIRQCAIQKFEYIKRVISSYDKIIKEYGEDNEGIYYLNWYKRRVLKAFYSSDQGVLSEQQIKNVMLEIFDNKIGTSLVN